MNNFDVVKFYKQLPFFHGSNQYLNSIINNSNDFTNKCLPFDSIAVKGIARNFAV